MIQINQAGFITISGMVISVAGGVNARIAAPVTEMVGGIAAMDWGAGALAAVNAGGQVDVIAGGDVIAKGATIKLNG